MELGQFWPVVAGTRSVWGGTGWYMVVLGQYNSVLLRIKLYWVSKGVVCLYILEKVDIWSGDTDASHTHSQQNIGLLSLSKV